MKFAGEPDRQRFVGAARRFLLADVLAQARRLLARELSGKPLYDEALQPAPNLEDVAGFVPAGLGHCRTAVTPKLDETLGGKLAERVPDEGTADAEALADRVLGQLRAGLERLLDDGMAERTVDGSGTITADLHRTLGHVSKSR